LIERLTSLIPELLELNHQPFDAEKPIDIVIRFDRKADKREERIRLPNAA
jgi:hypothetical protein